MIRKAQISLLIGLAVVVLLVLRGFSTRTGLAAGKNLAIPQFERYKVTRIYKGKPAVPILRTPKDREFRTRIRDGAKEGPNFAGHYTVIIIGCGTECASFVIVDAATGRVFSRAQREYTCGPIFELDSRLLATDVCSPIPTKCNRAFWEWTGTELNFLARIVIDCKDIGLPMK